MATRLEEDLHLARRIIRRCEIAIADPHVGIGEIEDRYKPTLWEARRIRAELIRMRDGA